MLKKYLDGKIVDWETIEICPHPPPTDPPQARQNAVAKRSEFTEVEGEPKGYLKVFFQFAQIQTVVVQTRSDSNY